MKPIRALFLGTTFLTSAFLASCGATGSVYVAAEIPLPGSGYVSINVELDINGNKVLRVESSETGCAQVCFSGPSGSLGCTTVEVPGSAPVPAGATDWSVEDVPCPNPGSNENQGLASGPGGSSVTVQAAQIGGSQKPKPATPSPNGQWRFCGGRVVPAVDGSKNISYSFEIQATSPAHAKARRDMVLAGGIGTAVGTGFDVILYNESTAEFDVTGFPTGARMRQADVNDDFTTYRLVVNGILFAELGTTGNLLHYGASHGWNVVETFVPTSAFETAPSAFDNQADADWTTAATTTTWHAMQRVFTN
jgi:hypothetical protein